jgi:tetratricopeptide (TPR) repeat protein
LKAAAAKGIFDAIFERFEAAVDEGRVELSEGAGYAVLEAYTVRGDHHLAIQKFTKIVNMVPLASWAWHCLSEAYKTAGLHEKAIEVLRSALQQIPLDYVFYKGLADLYLAKCDYHQVLNCHEQGVKFADEFGFAFIELGHVHLGHEGHRIPIDEAFQEYFVWHSVGEAYKGLGDHSRAVELYSAAVEAYQAVIGKTNGLWWSHTGLHIDPRGIRPVARSELRPEYIWTAAGLAYRAKGDAKGALCVLGKAHNLRPENAFLRKMICELEKEVSSTGNDRSGESDRA